MTSAIKSIDDLTVLIPTCDDEIGPLTRAFEAISQEPLSHPALIADMSRGNDIRRLAERFPAVRHLSCPESRGVSDSRNRLVAEADTRYVLFLDADAVPERGWANAMRGAFDRDSRIVVAGARCVPEWSTRPPWLFRTAPASDFLSLFDLGDEPLEIPTVMGTSYALDRTRLPEPPFPMELGFTRDRRLAGEEVALSLAVRRAGWSVVYEPRAVVRHVIPPTRTRWMSMQRRAYQAGQEARRLKRRAEPTPRLPRSMGWRDHLFLATVAPSYLVGRLRDRRK
jgi:GT2 family glycosyltransferase